jgi:hypothetical protein
VIYAVPLKIVDRLIGPAISHKAQRHRADPSYFLRAFAKEDRIPTYIGLDDEALQLGDRHCPVLEPIGG